MSLDVGLIDRQRKMVSDLRRLLQHYGAETKQADAALSSNLKRLENTFGAIRAKSHNAVAAVVSQHKSAVSALASSNRADLKRISTLKFPQVGSPRLPSSSSYSSELESRVSNAERSADRIRNLITALKGQTDKLGELGLARQALGLSVAAIVVTVYMAVRLSLPQASWSHLWLMLFAALLIAIANSRWSLTTNQAGRGFNWLYVLGGPISTLFALYYALYGYPKSVKAISSKYVGARDAKNLLDEIVRSLRMLVSLRTEAEYIAATWVKQAEAERDGKTASARAWHQARREALKTEYLRGREQLWRLRNAIQQESGLSGSDWSDPKWSRWSPARTEASPLVRIGLLTEVQDRQFTTPAFVPVIGGSNLLIKSPRDPRAMDQARQILKNAVLRLLATCPPGKIRFTFIDPTNSGEKMAPFMRLKDSDGSLVGPKVWTEEEAIEEQLRLLKEHIEIVIERYLSNRHNDIASYNREAGDVEEPYRVLVIEGFPSRFADRSVQRVQDIVRSGNRCGVHALILLDTDEQLPYSCGSTFVSELERNSTVVEWVGGRFVLGDPVFLHSSLEIDRESSSQLLNRILDAIGPEARHAAQIKVPFEKIMPRNQRLWTKRSVEGISIPIGRDLETNRTLDVTIGTMGGTAQNILIAGQVGTGKSNLLHVILTAMCSLYSPDEVNVHLLDMKQGLEFQTYANYDLPHMRSVVVCSDREAGLAILKKVQRMFEERKAMFGGHKHIETYRAETGRSLPRVMLVVDEYQVLFSGNDNITHEAEVILDTLLRQARAYGIHLVLSTQSVSGSGRLQPSSMDQIGIRIAMMLSDDESRMVLGERNPAASHLTRVGEAIFNSDHGRVEGNKRIQLALLEPHVQKIYLDAVVATTKNRSGYAGHEARIVFDSGLPADVEQCMGLVRLLNRPITDRVPTKVDFWLGEPTDLEPAALRLERNDGDNLIVMGADQEVVAGLFCISLAGVLLQYPGNSVKIAVVDLLDSHSSLATVVGFFQRALPGRVDVVKAHAMDSLLSSMSASLSSGDGDGVDEPNRSPHRFLFVLGLHRARELAGDDLYEEEDNDRKRFMSILRNGPRHGTHVWAWCDGPRSLCEKLGTYALQEFQKRVVLQISQDDSLQVTNSWAASTLGRERALLYDVRENQLRKVKPFGVPPKQWMQRVIERISGSGVVRPTSPGARTKPAKTEAAAGQRAPGSVSQPRCPCLILIDTSSFMGDEALRLLSNGLQVFKEGVQGNPLASTAVDLAVVTFDSEVRVMHHFGAVRDFQAVELTAHGSSCIVSAAIHKVLNLLEARRRDYRSSQVTYHQPWVLMITYGRFEGEKADAIESAWARIRQEHTDKRITFLAVGVNENGMDTLRRIAVRDPLRLSLPNTNDMFQWLAASMIHRCQSKPGMPWYVPPARWQQTAPAQE